MIKKIIRKLIYWPAMFLFMIVILEGVAQVWFYVEYKTWSFNKPIPVRTTDMELDRANIAYLRKDNPNLPYSREYFSGPRNTPLVKRENEIRILVMGGSTAVSYPDERFPQSWAGALGQKLQKAYPDKIITVLNQAHGSYVTTDNLILYALLSQDYQFDLVLVYEGWNDNWVQTAQNFQPDYSHARARPQNALSANHFIQDVFIAHPWIRFSGVLSFILHKLNEATITRFNENIYRGEHAPMKGVYGLETYQRNLRSLCAIARENGSRVVLVSQISLNEAPGCWNSISAAEWIRARVNNENNLAMSLVADSMDGVEYFDAASIYPQSGRYFTDCLHFSLDGHELVAELLTRFLEDNDLVRQWSPPYAGPRVVTPFNSLDVVEKLGPQPGTWNPILDVRRTGSEIRPALRIQADALVRGAALPLGDLSPGRYVLDTGLYLEDQRGPAKRSAVKFEARITTPDSDQTVLSVPLKAGENYDEGSFLDYSAPFTLEHAGPAKLVLQVQDEGLASGDIVLTFWTWPILHHVQPVDGTKALARTEYLAGLAESVIHDQGASLQPGNEYQLIRDFPFKTGGDQGNVAFWDNTYLHPGLTLVRMPAEVSWDLELPNGLDGRLIFAWGHEAAHGGAPGEPLLRLSIMEDGAPEPLVTQEYAALPSGQGQFVMSQPIDLDLGELAGKKVTFRFTSLTGSQIRILDPWLAFTPAQ